MRGESANIKSIIFCWMDTSNQMNSKFSGKHLNYNNNSTYLSNICNFSLSYELIWRSICCNFTAPPAAKIWGNFLHRFTGTYFVCRPRWRSLGLQSKEVRTGANQKRPSDNELYVCKAKHSGEYTYLILAFCNSLQVHMCQLHLLPLEPSLSLSDFPKWVKLFRLFDLEKCAQRSSAPP